MYHFSSIISIPNHTVQFCKFRFKLFSQFSGEQ